MQKFTKQLSAFCYICEYIDELNPPELHNSGTRILRRVENPFTKKREQKEMIYLRTKQEAARQKSAASTESSNLFPLDKAISQSSNNTPY